jgi:hypothetical protein
MCSLAPRGLLSRTRAQKRREWSAREKKNDPRFTIREKKNGVGAATTQMRIPRANLGGLALLLLLLASSGTKASAAGTPEPEV